MKKCRILGNRVERVVDDSPDLSWIGEYGNAAESPNAIDRKERGDMDRGEYRYFNPSMTGEETGNPDSPEEDYRRMESYNNGDWCMLGIIAKAEILTPSGTRQTIRSSGLWGVESDSGEDYLKDVGAEQLVELRAELESLGIGSRAISRAFQHVETKNA